MDLSNKDVIHIKNNEEEYLQFKILLKYPEITHAYILGINNNFRIIKNPKNEFEKKQNENSKNNYKKICKILNLNYNYIEKANQSHTDKIKIIKNTINPQEPNYNLSENFDGLITNEKNIVLATTNADCILLFFYDPINKVIANVHSGWRGTIQRISVKCIEKMKENFNCKPENIICCMSPSIGKDHFEVDEDVYNMFMDEFQDLKYEKNIYKKLQNYNSINNIINNTSILNTNSNIEKHKYLIDTILINRLILKKAGLKEENIVDSGICSVCNKDIIHSFRAEGPNYGLTTQIISKN